MTKNIAVNLLSVSPEKATGSFIYIKNLLDKLLVLDKDNFYYLILSSDNCRYFKVRYGGRQNVRCYVFDISRDILLNPVRAVLKLLAKIKKDRQMREVISKKEIQHLINKNKIDIVFFPSGTLYPGGLQNIKTVTTVFDLQHEYFPNNFSETYLNRRKRDSAYVACNSDHIIAISEFTKKTLIEKYKINSEKISVIYLAPQEQNTSPYSQLTLPDDFIFYPAAVWPHKNHKVLVGAFNLLKFEFPNLSLIFSGSIKNRNLKKELDSLIVSCGLKDRINFLGFVKDEDVSLIYKRAKVVVYPSSFEGFGIPLVEAFNYGVPLIAANNTSVGEVVGTAGVLVETGNIRALADAIKEVLSDENLRRGLIKKGHERVKDFLWDTTANKTLELFNSL